MNFLVDSRALSTGFPKTNHPVKAPFWIEAIRLSLYTSLPFCAAFPLVFSTKMD